MGVRTRLEIKPYIVEVIGFDREERIGYNTLISEVSPFPFGISFSVISVSLFRISSILIDRGFLFCAILFTPRLNGVTFKIQDTKLKLTCIDFVSTLNPLYTRDYVFKDTRYNNIIYFLYRERV